MDHAMDHAMDDATDHGNGEGVLRRTRLRDTWLLHRRELLTLTGWYAGLVLAWSCGGWLLVHPLGGSGLAAFDDRAERWFAGHRTPTWNTLSLVGSQLAETGEKIVVTAIVCLVLVRLAHRWLEPLVVAVSLVLEAMVFISVTWIVQRPRPDVPRLDGSPVDSSFPSGHAAAAACYGAIAVVVFWRTRNRWLRALTVAVMIALPIIVSFARMYRGMHHPTDVVAGVLLGAVCVTVTTRVLAIAESRRQSSVALEVADHPNAHLAPARVTPARVAALSRGGAE
jgi:undecaprenyl-diphosphatase